MKFSEEIIATLEYLCSKFGVAIDWTSDNVMPYLEDLCARYIQYEIYTSIAWIVVGVGITALLWILLNYYTKNCSHNFSDDDYQIIGTLLILLLFSFIATILVTVVQAFDIIECCTLPEKVILEYLQTLIESN